jgi:hypothetical protein
MATVLRNTRPVSLLFVDWVNILTIYELFSLYLKETKQNSM